MKIIHNVHLTHRYQDTLRQPRTRYGGKVSVYAGRQWNQHRKLWHTRLSTPQWVYRAIWPRSTWTTLSCVIERESGWSVTADNPVSTASGLLQILGGPKTVWGNLRMGYRMYLASGWQPWRGGYPSCSIY